MKGIIMAARQVQSLLDGRMTQTRRIPCWHWHQHKKGEVLYVKETFRLDDRGVVIYRATDPTNHEGAWRSPLHMAMRDSRFRLTLTADAWVERVRDITQDDARAEGFDGREAFFEEIKRLHPELMEYGTGDLSDQCAVLEFSCISVAPVEAANGS